MKKLLYLVVGSVVALIAGLTGCADEMPEMKQAEKGHTSKEGKSALDMALERADEFFAQIGAATRTPRRVATVNTIAGATTRSESDTLLFLVNYADNQGFALLGADPSINDIYAISPTGSLTYEDIDANPVLADFLYDVVSYVINPALNDSIKGVEWKYYRYKNIAVGKPLITTVASGWHQGYPYNMFCKNSSGEIVPPGCTAVSLGTVLSFYRKPDSLNYTWTYTSPKKFEFNWATMLGSDNPGKRDSVTAQMFSFLGNKNLLNVEYDEGSAATGENIASAISTLGGGSCIFQKTSMSGNIDTIADFIINGRKITTWTQRTVYKAAPLIIGGIKANDSNNNNHAWVIDGAIKRQRCATDASGKPIGQTAIYTKALPMWHCLWGWGNDKADGWYVYLKDTRKLDSVQYDPFSNKVNSAGLWPTGVQLMVVYRDWSVYGGCFPEIQKVSVSLN